LGTGYLLALEDSPRTRRACATVYQRFVYSAYPNALDLLEIAEARVRELGGTDVKPGGTPLFRLLASGMGWKKATLMQERLYRMGYGKLTPGRPLAKIMRRLRYLKHQQKTPVLHK
jgi:hypothetical protein